jgi:hypothetical protein
MFYINPRSRISTYYHLGYSIACQTRTKIRLFSRYAIVIISQYGGNKRADWITAGIYWLLRRQESPFLVNEVNCGATAFTVNTSDNMRSIDCTNNSYLQLPFIYNFPRILQPTV